MSEPQVTVVIVPRERFSHSERTLENVYQETTLPFKLIYVSAGTPEPMYRRIAAKAESKGFKLIHTDQFLSPN
ncbi:MAG: glycosyltransferase family 2 protein, partial [Candidatus Binatia bacterium]